MIKIVICLYCRRYFIPSKYKPTQKACSDQRCQQRRRLDGLAKWRSNNPDYFDYKKRPEWAQMMRDRARTWRQANPERVKLYRERRRSHYNAYMREYMRAYRNRRKQDTAPA